LPRLPRQARIFSDLDAEMKRIMQNAVDHVYQVLLLKENDPETYQEEKTIFILDVSLSRKIERFHHCLLGIE